MFSHAVLEMLAAHSNQRSNTIKQMQKAQFLPHQLWLNDSVLIFA